MRIGELLIECGLITPKQLAGGLEYARAKGLPIGRVLKLLRHLDEEHLDLALLGQKCIRGGMEPPVVVSTIRECVETKQPFEQVLKARKLNTAEISTIKELEAASNAAKPGPPATAAELRKLGEEALNEDRLDAAENRFQQSLRLLEKEADTKPIELAEGCSRLASFYLLTDRWSEAEHLYLRAMTLRQQKLGEDDISIAVVYQDLADLYDVWDQDARSIHYALAACTVLEKHLPGSFNDFYAPLRKLIALSIKLPQAPRRRMGELLTETGMLSQEKLQVALQRAKQTAKPLGSVLRDDLLLNERDLQSILSAQLMMKEGMLTEEVAVEALKLACRMSMPLRAVIEHFKLLSAATDDDELAELVMEQDRLLSAENGLGVNHPEVGVIAASLADKYFVRNSLADAETFYKRTLAIHRLTQSIPADVETNVCEHLAKIYYDTGRGMQASPLLLRALELLARAQQSESERSAEALFMLAELEVQQKNYLGALCFVRSAVAVAEKVYGPTDSQTAKYFELFGDIQSNLGEAEEAEAHYFRSRQLYEYSLNAPTNAVAHVSAKIAALKNPARK